PAGEVLRRCRGPTATRGSLVARCCPRGGVAGNLPWFLIPQAAAPAARLDVPCDGVARAPPRPAGAARGAAQGTAVSRWLAAGSMASRFLLPSLHPHKDSSRAERKLTHSVRLAPF